MIDVFRKLRYSDSEFPSHELPRWALFFLSIGSHIIQDSPKELRRVLAVSVPTRHFCSAFIASGAIGSLASSNSSSTSEKDQGFTYFRDLPSGTTMIINKPNGKTIVGIKMETTEDKYIKIKVETDKLKGKKGGIVEVFTQDTYTRLSLSPHKLGNLPSEPTDMSHFEGYEFRSALFGKPATNKFYAKDSLECVIIGELKTLHHELQEPLLSIMRPQRASNTQGRLFGKFQDIIHSEPSTTAVSKIIHGYKSKVLSDRMSDNPSDAELPKLTLFDSPNAYKKWKHYFTKSHVVVILDRTTRQYSDGVQEINDDYINRTCDYALPQAINIPPGIDTTGYFQKIV